MRERLFVASLIFVLFLIVPGHALSQGVQPSGTLTVTAIPERLRLFRQAASPMWTSKRWHALRMGRFALTEIRYCSRCLRRFAAHG